MVAISGWRAPHRKVWWTVVCSNCQKVLGRYLLPGLIRQTTYRLCDECSTTSPQQRQETPTPPPTRRPRRASQS